MENSLKIKEKIIRERWVSFNPNYTNKKYCDYVYNRYLKQRITKGISMRHLAAWTTRSSFDPIMKTSSELLKEVRITPYEIFDKNPFRIYDDTIEIISCDDKNEILSIVIKDKYVIEMLKNMFDFIWERSTVFYGKTILPTRKISKNTETPILGMGSWGIGGYQKRNPYNDDLNDVEQMKHAIGMGISYIDASLSYAEGSSVDLIAKAIGHIPRESLFINGKLTLKLTSVKDIAKQCDEYLKKLDIEYLDSFQIHSPRRLSGFSISTVIREMDKLIDKGKVKHISVSNFNVEQLKEALGSAQHGIATHEIHYNLIIRANEENEVVDFCNRNNILMIVYQPLRRGFIYSLEDNELISQLCKKYNKTPDQLAINWLVNKPNLITICKSTNGSHINENIAALDWQMTDEDYRKLDIWRMPGYKTPEYDKTGVAKNGLSISNI